MNMDGGKSEHRRKVLCIGMIKLYREDWQRKLKRDDVRRIKLCIGRDRRRKAWRYEVGYIDGDKQMAFSTRLKGEMLKWSSRQEWKEGERVWR